MEEGQRDIDTDWNFRGFNLTGFLQIFVYEHLYIFLLGQNFFQNFLMPKFSCSKNFFRFLCCQNTWSPTTRCCGQHVGEISHNQYILPKKECRCTSQHVRTDYGDWHCTAKFKLRIHFSHHQRKHCKNSPFNFCTSTTRNNSRVMAGGGNHNGTNVSPLCSKLGGCEQC